MLKKKKTFYILLLFFIVISALYILDNIEPVKQVVSQQVHIPKVIIENNGIESSTDKPKSFKNTIENTALNIQQITESNKNTQTDYIIDCSKEITESQSNELALIHDNIFREKLDTNIANEQLAKILFSPDSSQLNKGLEQVQLNRSSLIESLYQYHLNYPTDKLSYFRLLTECSQTNLSYCDNDFYQKAKQIDNNNGFVWLTIASLYLNDKNLLAAHNALYQASISNIFNDYFFELIFLYHEITKKYVPEKANKLLITGVGYAAAIPLGYSKAINHCSKAEIDNHVTLETCLKIGRLMEDNSTTLIYSAMGVALQKFYYEKHGNSEKVKESENISKSLMIQSGSQQRLEAEKLMFHDSELTDQWLNYALQHGEQKAITYIIDEAIWRSKDENYHPCPIQ